MQCCFQSRRFLDGAPRTSVLRLAVVLFAMLHSNRGEWQYEYLCLLASRRNACETTWTRDDNSRLLLLSYGKTQCSMECLSITTAWLAHTLLGRLNKIEPLLLYAQLARRGVLNIFFSIHCS
jgi:hypothetical protein